MSRWQGGKESGEFLGSEGIDWVEYVTVPYVDVKISAKEDYSELWISHGLGMDHLIHIERLRFADDTTLALDVISPYQAAGAALALLYVAFDRMPDPELLGRWIAVADGLAAQGVTGQDLLTGIAQRMLDAYAPHGVSHAALVDLLYRNIMGVAPDRGTLDHFVGLLDNGTYSQAGLCALAASTAQNQAQYAEALWLDWITYLPASTDLWA